MAKIVFPHMVRELCSQVGSALRINLGVPMNVEIPPSTDELSRGRAVLHFPGYHFVVDMETGRDPSYGQYVRVVALTGKIHFWTSEEAREWIENLQRFSGPTEWEKKNRKLFFKLSGRRLARLQMNASSRANGLPECEWDDPNHPWVVWGKEIGDPEYPHIPE